MRIMVHVLLFLTLVAPDSMSWATSRSTRLLLVEGSGYLAELTNSGSGTSLLLKNQTRTCTYAVPDLKLDRSGAIPVFVSFTGKRGKCGLDFPEMIKGRFRGSHEALRGGITSMDAKFMIELDKLVYFNQVDAAWR